MKKISLITSLLLLTTTQSLLLMDAIQQKRENYRQYNNSVVQETNTQIGFLWILESEIVDSGKSLDQLCVEFNSTKQLSIQRQQIDQIKTQAIKLRETLTQSLVIQQGINNNYSIIKQANTSLISDEKERNEKIQDLTQKMNFSQKKTISCIKELEGIQKQINDIGVIESSIEKKLKKITETATSIRKTFITSIALYLIIVIILTSRYVYENYNGNVSLLFKKA